MDLKLITDFTESHQYRSKQAFHGTSARQVCDFAFMDLVAIWILLNEFEFTPFAQDYAGRTSMFNGFTKFRQMSTDLYLNLHVITEKRTDLLSSEADANLLDKIHLDVRGTIRYLRNAKNNNLNPGQVRQALQRAEQALYIDNSNYKSIRRLAQNWPKLLTSQKRTVLTRMMFFYRTHAQRSEVYKQLQALAKSHGLEDKAAKNPEKKGNVAAKAAAAAAAAGAGYAAGYRIGKSWSQ